MMRMPTTATGARTWWKTIQEMTTDATCRAVIMRTKTTGPKVLMVWKMKSCPTAEQLASSRQSREKLGNWDMKTKEG